MCSPAGDICGYCRDDGDRVEPTFRCVRVWDFWCFYLGKFCFACCKLHFLAYSEVDLRVDWWCRFPVETRTISAVNWMLCKNCGLSRLLKILLFCPIENQIHAGLNLRTMSSWHSFVFCVARIFAGIFFFNAQYTCRTTARRSLACGWFPRKQANRTGFSGDLMDWHCSAFQAGQCRTNHHEAWWTKIIWTTGLEWNKSTVSYFLGLFVLLSVQDVVQKRKLSKSNVVSS